MKSILVGLSLVVIAASQSLAADAPGGPVTIKVTGDAIEFRAGDELVARYNKGESVAKPYLWPVNAPGAIPVTRGWPMIAKQAGGTEDHIHQKSAWFCHGDVIPEGVEIKDKIKGVVGADFWSENKAHGKMICTKVGEPKGEKNHGMISTHNEWQTSDGIKLIDEDRTIHLYDFGNARLFVFDIDLHATGATVTFGDTKEGSFGVRVNDVMREQKGNGKLENASGGTGELAVWGRKSPWCDYSGSVDGKKVGIAILDDPNNQYPAYWHSRGYGLMAANPFGRAKSGFPDAKGKTELVKLPKGEHLKLRYGIFVHLDDAKGGKVAEYFDKFTKLK
jgi:hypothetical protein